jgi:cytidine deaminase
LRPQIEARRTELARQFGSDWKHRFRLMNTLTSGAPSRMLSIHNALRRFQPHTLHVWQLKSFWHEYPKVAYLKDKDVEFQRFRATELSPPILTTQITDTLIATMVAEMRSHRDSFQTAIDGGDHEIKKFWLRKTHQPVLAILVTQKDGESPKYWRGMNVEVSMPTGSLCSERAAIAAALAQDPTLSRRHFRMIAVLSMPQLQAITSTHVRAIFPPETTTHLMLPKSIDELTRSSSAPVHSAAGPIYDRIPSHRASLGSPVLSSSGGSAPPPLTSPISPPMSPAKPAMLATIAPSSSQQAKDLNPLAPCGSCKEWLKKIAECNPDFKVITFTSTSLDNVFVDPVIDWS